MGAVIDRCTITDRGIVQDILRGSRAGAKTRSSVYRPVLRAVARDADGTISPTGNLPSGYDYDAIARSLQEGATIGIMRYLPPGNGRNESIVVANDGFLIPHALATFC